MACLIGCVATLPCHLRRRQSAPPPSRAWTTSLRTTIWCCWTASRPLRWATRTPWWWPESPWRSPATNRIVDDYYYNVIWLRQYIYHWLLYNQLHAKQPHLKNSTKRKILIVRVFIRAQKRARGDGQEYSKFCGIAVLDNILHKGAWFCWLETYLSIIVWEPLTVTQGGAHWPTNNCLTWFSDLKIWIINL